MYGLIFLFKYNAGEPPSGCIVDGNETGSSVFFAKQVIQNACATQAILSILMNCPPSVKIGDILTQLKDFTTEFDADLKGLALSNSEQIRTAHNAFARPEPIVADPERKPQHDDEAFHFVAYVPVGGRLYELDGLKQGPIDHGPIVDSTNYSTSDGTIDGTWLGKVCPVIQTRIAKYSASEIRFNLMALVRDRAEMLGEKIERAERKIQRCQIVLGGGDDAVGGDAMDVDSLWTLPVDTENLETEIVKLSNAVLTLRDDLQLERERQRVWRDENIRRRHNYIPFIFNLLKVLGEKNKLGALIEKAKR